MLAAQGHIPEGCSWTADIGLEKFFDAVQHDKLMSLAAGKASDTRLLKLIGRCLESGVLISGMEAAAEDGVPQGGPLSPLPSNIMLGELDKELERRGRKFVGYADGCSICVKSKRAGLRVFESIRGFLETSLKLKVNMSKSAADRPERLKFLGFSFCGKNGEPKIRIHPRPIKRLKEKLRDKTSRNWGVGMEYRLKKPAEITSGWLNCCGLTDAASILEKLGGRIRRRLRACIWKTWKKIKARYKNLMKLGLSKEKAWEFANTRKGCRRVSKSPILTATITNLRLEKKGFKSLVKRHHEVH
jgi:hypothetical protein